MVFGEAETSLMEKGFWESMVPSIFPFCSVPVSSAQSLFLLSLAIEKVFGWTSSIVTSVSIQMLWPAKGLSYLTK